MVSALLIGKHTSGGVPGKNYTSILGRPMVEYALLAAANSALIDRIYVSTDSPDIVKSAKKFNAEIIPRPEELAQSESPTEEAYAHGYREILKTGERPDYLVLMFANSPCVTAENLDHGINKLIQNEDYDSVISVVNYNMFAPMRARKLVADGTSEPLLDLASMNLDNTFHRDAQGDIYYCDFGVQVVRPERCLLDFSAAKLPFLWLGNRQGTITLPGGFDVDAPWQIPAVEFWLKQLGFSETTTPYQ